MLDSIVKLAKEIVGPEPGFALAMAVLAGLFAYAYWDEKKQKEALQKERHEEMKAQLEDAKEETKEMTEAVINGQKAIEGFSKSLEAILAYIRR